MLDNRRFLKEQYLVRKRSATSIAKELGVSKSTVLRALENFGIARRSRAESLQAAYDVGGRTAARKGLKATPAERAAQQKRMIEWWASRTPEQRRHHSELMARNWKLQGWRKRKELRRKGGRIAAARLPGRSKVGRHVFARLTELGFEVAMGVQPVDMTVRHEGRTYVIMLDGYFRMNKSPEKRAARRVACLAGGPDHLVRVQYWGRQFTRGWGEQMVAAITSFISAGAGAPAEQEFTFGKEESARHDGDCGGVGGYEPADGIDVPTDPAGPGLDPLRVEPAPRFGGVGR